MLEKLLIAVMVTFSLNLFLGIRLPSTNLDASSSYQAQMPNTLVRLLLKDQASRQNL